MPQIIPVLATVFSAIGSAAPVIAGVSGAVGLGESIANMTSGPPKVSQPPTLPTAPTALPPAISPSAVSQANSTSAADIQARGGGGLSPLFTQLIEQGIGGGGSAGGGVPYTGA